MSKRIITVGSGRTKESMDTYGHNAPKPMGPYPMPCCMEEEKPVPHEDVDTDDQRKMDNRMHHSSYRK